MKLYLLPGTAGGVISAPLGGRLVARFGAKATLVLTGALAALGFAMLAVLHSATWEVIVGALVVNTAVTFGTPPCPLSSSPTWSRPRPASPTA